MSFFTIGRRKGKQSSEQSILKSLSHLDEGNQQSSRYHSENRLKISTPTPLSSFETAGFVYQHRQRERQPSISISSGPFLEPIRSSTLSSSTPNLHKIFKSASGLKQNKGQKQKDKDRERDNFSLNKHSSDGADGGDFDRVNRSSISQNSISSFENEIHIEKETERVTGSETGTSANKKNENLQSVSASLLTSSTPSLRPISGILRSTSLFDQSSKSSSPDRIRNRNSDQDRDRHEYDYGSRSISRTRSRSPTSPSLSPPNIRKKQFEFKTGKLTNFVSMVANGGSNPQPHYKPSHQPKRTNSSNSLSGDLYINSKLKTKRHFAQRSSPALYKRSGSGRALDEVQDVIKENEAFEHVSQLQSGPKAKPGDEADASDRYDSRHQLHPTVSMMTISSSIASIASSNNSISSASVSASASSSSISTSTNVPTVLTSVPVLQRRNSSGSVNINLRRKEEDIHNVNVNVNAKSKNKVPPAGQFMSLNRPKKSAEEIKKADVIIRGIKKFNRDASKGIEFLIKNQMVGNTAQDVAKFLKKGENLSKTAIGTYLGEFDEFNQSVLHEFVKLHDFSDQYFVTSLRQFLWSFRLPGEAQKIDRMMECFAQHYCELNPQIFSCTDTCYIISFATIMLNTTLHNPNVKDKQTVEQFISMNRDIDKGKSLDPVFLTSLYNNIRNEKFQIPTEEGSDLNLTFYKPDIKGWLWKQGARYKTWTRRWFILSNNCLYYFKHSTQDKSPRGIIPLENIEAQQGTFNGKYFTFILTKSQTGEPLIQTSSGKSKANQTTASKESIKSCKTLSDGTLVLGTHSEYVLGADNEEERTAWIQSIQQNRSFDDCYTLLREKKRKMNVLTAKPTIKLRDKKHPKKNDGRAEIRKSQIGLPLTRPKTHANVEGVDVEGEAEGDYGDDQGMGFDDDDNSSLILRMAQDQDHDTDTDIDLDHDHDHDPGQDEDESSSIDNYSASNIYMDKIEKFHIPFVDVTMGSVLLEEIPPTPNPYPFPKSSSPCSVQIHVSDTDNNICEISGSSGETQSPRRSCVIHLNSNSNNSNDSSDCEETSECHSESGGESVTENETENETELEEEEFEPNRNSRPPPLTALISLPPPPPELLEQSPPETPSTARTMTAPVKVSNLAFNLRDLQSLCVDDTPQVDPTNSNIFTFLVPGSGSAGVSSYHYPLSTTENDNECKIPDDAVDSVFLDDENSDLDPDQLPLPVPVPIANTNTNTRMSSQSKPEVVGKEEEIDILPEAEATKIITNTNRTSQSRGSTHDLEVLQLQVSTANLILESSC